MGAGVRARTLRRLLLIAVATLCGVARAEEPKGAGNVVPLVVRTPRGGFNRLVVSLTICEPGTDRCARVDDVLVDTGSAGLRIAADALPPGFRPPPALGPDGRPLAECLHYLHDVAWGAVHRVDLRIGGLAVPDLPVQIVDGEAQPRPHACPASDARPTANGTLGIGPELSDCPGRCLQSTDRPLVFACGPGGCEPIPGRIDPADRLPNPVARMALHGNGIVIELPSAPAGGAVSVAGTLTFGIGTADNNRLGPVALVRPGPGGRFTTLYRGAVLPESYIDSGTPTYILPDSELPRCETMRWAYCATPPLDGEAQILDRDGAPVRVPFRVGSFREVLDRMVGASDDAALAAEPDARAFVWGAPFFLGRRVAVVLDGRSVPGATPDIIGPLYAFR